MQDILIRNSSEARQRDGSHAGGGLLNCYLNPHPQPKSDVA